VGGEVGSAKLSAVSEIERSSGDVTRPERSGQPSKRDVDQHAELYQITYEESQRALDDQKDELGNVRDRAVQFAIFIGAATAFLVGTGLQAPHRDTSFYILAIVASAASLVMIWLLFQVLNPSRKHEWHYRLSPDVLISEFIERDVPAPSRAEFVRALAKINGDSQIQNEKLLLPLRYLYRLLIVVGAGQVIIWAALVWWKG
jgi:hypothetical protein